MSKFNNIIYLFILSSSLKDQKVELISRRWKCIDRCAGNRICRRPLIDYAIGCRDFAFFFSLSAFFVLWSLSALAVFFRETTLATQAQRAIQKKKWPTNIWSMHSGLERTVYLQALIRGYYQVTNTYTIQKYVEFA